MSTIYNLEPQPTASVILHTTQGDLSVELFAKQTPLTSRNFLQLCIDGYYDDTIFHRLVPGFILQGGDPTGTGNGGESIYDGGGYSGDLDPWPADQRHGKNAGPTGVNFRDEFHSRLKFSRRGLLGMANEGKPDTNGSQFFLTLDKADELNNKNTVFGRIVGDTIYNLARMGEADVAEGSDRPLYPVKITGVEILANPFEDMKKRGRQAPVTTAVVTQRKKKQPKHGKKLLSFGDEEGDSEAAPIIKKAKKFDTRIVMDIEEESSPHVKPPTRSIEKKSEEAGPKPKLKPTEDIVMEEDLKPTAPPVSPKKQAAKRNYADYSSPEPEPPKEKSALERANEEIAALKASMKRSTLSEPVKEVKKTGIEQFIPETSTRGRKRRKGGEATMSASEIAIYEAFKSKLRQVPPAPDQSAPQTTGTEATETPDADGQDEEAELCDLHFIANCQSCQSWDKAEAEKEDSDDEGWMAHTLSFTADKLGKDLTYRRKAEDELVVIDPREKARTLKEEKRARQDARAGGSGREWDQARNQKLARQSALVGRGAK
jgi:peptidyl-prolyl cis-trans isomerase SDCCAG10